MNDLEKFNLSAQELTLLLIEQLEHMLKTVSLTTFEKRNPADIKRDGFMMDIFGHSYEITVRKVK